MPARSLCFPPSILRGPLALPLRRCLPLVLRLMPLDVLGALLLATPPPVTSRSATRPHALTACTTHTFVAAAGTRAIAQGVGSITSSVPCAPSPPQSRTSTCSSFVHPAATTFPSGPSPSPVQCSRVSPESHPQEPDYRQRQISCWQPATGKHLKKTRIVPRGAPC
ncbi:hypothetical protein T484DRAFT_2870159 [Baffinella frigidus]|nr:hypothetical protein T484DRAFT_2870159 [Cryptophyta sp. CCMP2293]